MFQSLNSKLCMIRFSLPHEQCVTLCMSVGEAEEQAGHSADTGPELNLADASASAASVGPAKEGSPALAIAGQPLLTMASQCLLDHLRSAEQVSVTTQ